MIAIHISFNLMSDTSPSRDGKPKNAKTAKTAKTAKRTAKRCQKRPNEAKRAKRKFLLKIYPVGLERLKKAKIAKKIKNEYK